MNNDTDITMSVIDQNTRRYYLDTMGIQCWQLRDEKNRDSRDAANTHSVSHGVSADITDTNVIDCEYVQIQKTVQQCTACQLHNTRKQTITGRGNLSANLLFVLLAPDNNDDEAGVLCSGEGGLLLSKMLSAINISIDDVFITSLLKCKVSATHTVSPKEIRACNDHLTQLVRLIKPKRIVVLGEATIRCLLQNNMSLDDFRSMNADSQYQLASVPIFVSYSPNELLQQADNKRKAWADLQQLQNMIEM